MHRKGFTLVELTLSTAIIILSSGMVLSVILNLVRAENQQAIEANLNHNGLTISQTLNRFLPQGDNIGAGSSLASHPSSLIIEIPTSIDDDITIDTYTQIVPLGDGTTTIRTLRYTQNSQSYDLTDQDTNVTNFTAYNRTLSSESQNVELVIELEPIDLQYNGQGTTLHYSYTLQNS